ncbi:uncharacterized protein B0I36DRAFT_321343 [Microdochium trichocladiopsis]|uniref:2EXR domain-containing protein n=1 Tax=Microdochium trichocladiopsis TaxID=1682393 RepID=A0A9P8Y954_9PEZI|nr:uncharacterized protein B0I36DRAFT_321343 [Microdochium trichocladiopsis]KAH7033392.1 hypothetical protein B0I36DRAFT_321343 [Microdochium trichocladiopsis]
MAPTTPDKTANTGCFASFGLLPPEIRIKIWHYSIPAPRLVAIRSPYHGKQQALLPTSLADVLASCYDDSTTERISWRSDTTPPALLHVNAEARHEALKYYRLALGVEGSKPQIYIDFERDTLFFGNAELEGRCNSLWGSTPDLKFARRLAIVPEGAWRVLRWWRDLDLDSLRELVFVHGSETLDFTAPLPPLLEDAAALEQEDVDEAEEDARAKDEDEDGDMDSKDRVVVAAEEVLEDTAETLAELSKQEVSEGSRATIPELAIRSPASTTPMVPKARPEPPRRRRSEEIDAAAIKRQQDARDELATLMMALPTLWSKEPRFTTATFQTPVSLVSAQV